MQRADEFEVNFKTVNFPMNSLAENEPEPTGFTKLQLETGKENGVARCLKTEAKEIFKQTMFKCV